MAPSGERSEENAEFGFKNISLMHTLPKAKRVSYRIWRVNKERNSL
jgi:hypothetical protein